MSELIEGIAARHVAQSLEELRDPAKHDRWASGERASDEAREIVSALLQAAIQRLEQEN